MTNVMLHFQCESQYKPQLFWLGKWKIIIDVLLFEWILLYPSIETVIGINYDKPYIAHAIFVFIS